MKKLTSILVFLFTSALLFAATCGDTFNTTFNSIEAQLEDNLTFCGQQTIGVGLCEHEANTIYNSSINNALDVYDCCVNGC